MDELHFQIQGSATEPYEVTISRSPSGLIATCTCAAAEAGTHCKHRLELLLGTSSSIVSGNKHDMATAATWLAGSALEAALAEVAAAEAQLAAAKTRLAQSKRRLSAAFLS